VRYRLARRLARDRRRAATIRKLGRGLDEKLRYDSVEKPLAMGIRSR